MSVSRNAVMVALIVLISHQRWPPAPKASKMQWERKCSIEKIQTKFFQPTESRAMKKHVEIPSTKMDLTINIFPFQEIGQI